MAAEEVIPRQSEQSGTRLRAGAIGLAGLSEGDEAWPS